MKKVLKGLSGTLVVLGGVGVLAGLVAKAIPAQLGMAFPWMRLCLTPGGVMAFLGTVGLYLTMPKKEKKGGEPDEGK